MLGWVLDLGLAASGLSQFEGEVKFVEYRPKVNMRLEGSFEQTPRLVALEEGDTVVRNQNAPKPAQRVHSFQAKDSLGGQTVDFTGIVVNIDAVEVNSGAFQLVNDEIEILRDGTLVVDVRTTIGASGKNRFSVRTEVQKNGVFSGSSFHVAAQATTV